MKTIVIGVMPQEQIRARAIAIAKGEYKPKPGEPKIWFRSMKSVAEVLTDQNRALLKVIRETKPDSMTVLARATGRQAGSKRSGLRGPGAVKASAYRRDRFSLDPATGPARFRRRSGACLAVWHATQSTGLATN